MEKTKTMRLNKKINFMNNEILHLFDKIDYYIENNKIKSIVLRNRDVATTTKGLVSFE